MASLHTSGHDGLNRAWVFEKTRSDFNFTRSDLKKTRSDLVERSCLDNAAFSEWAGRTCEERLQKKLPAGQNQRVIGAVYRNGAAAQREGGFLRRVFEKSPVRGLHPRRDFAAMGRPSFAARASVTITAGQVSKGFNAAVAQKWPPAAHVFAMSQVDFNE